MYPPIYKYLKKVVLLGIIYYLYIIMKKFTIICRSYHRCATTANTLIFLNDRTKFFKTKCSRISKVNNFTILSNILYIIHVLYYPSKWLNLLKEECEWSACIIYHFPSNTFSRIMITYTNTRSIWVNNIFFMGRCVVCGYTLLRLSNK